MRKITSLRFSVAFLAVAGSSLLEFGCSKADQAAGPNMATMGTPVTAISAVAQDVPVYLDEIGKAVATQSVTVYPQVSGVVISQAFEDGKDVKKDQLLFEIDPRPFQAQLDQAKGQLAKDQALKTTAEWNVKQDQAAMDAKAISEQQLHNDTGQRDQAIGAIAVDQAEIETAQLNLNYCKIKSPIDGRAGHRLIDVGNVVTAAGQAPGTSLLSIQTLDPIYADFTITEAELSEVQQYMNEGTLQVQVQLPQDATAAPATQPATEPVASSQPAGTEIPRIGTLTFLDNSVQDGTGTVKLRANLPNTDHHFWPGQFVNIRLVLTVKKGAVLIPALATQVSQKGPYVYVVTKDSTAALTPVTLGQRQGDMVVIESGLNAGDQVVVTGQMLIQPQGKLMVTNQSPPAATAKPTKTASASISGEGSQL